MCLSSLDRSNGQRVVQLSLLVRDLFTHHNEPHLPATRLPKPKMGVTWCFKDDIEKDGTKKGACKRDSWMGTKLKAWYLQVSWAADSLAMLN